jgi:hypothetical protein
MDFRVLESAPTLAEKSDLSDPLDFYNLEAGKWVQLHGKEKARGSIRALSGAAWH